jgi:hypothetical protein
VAVKMNIVGHSFLVAFIGQMLVKSFFPMTQPKEIRHLLTVPIIINVHREL